MVSILFFIKRSKLLKSGEAPIFLRVTVEGKRSETSIGRSVNPNQWISAKGRARSTSPANKQLNCYLDQQEVELYHIQKELKDEEKLVTAYEIMQRYRGDDRERISIIELYERHNEKLKELVGKTTAEATYKRHTTSLKLFKEFLQRKYRRNDMMVREVTVPVLEDYRHYLMTARNSCNNSAVKYLRNLGRVLSVAVTKSIIRQSPLNQISLRLDDVEKDFLTEEELKRLIEKTFEIKRLEQVRDVFAFCCYTGLAHADVKSLILDHLVSGKQGKLWLHKARQKTKQICHIPLLSPAMKILQKYSAYAKVTGKLLPVLSNQKMNAYLKEIADLCQIRKQLTTHIARHSILSLGLKNRKLQE